MHETKTERLKKSLKTSFLLPEKPSSGNSECCDSNIAPEVATTKFSATCKANNILGIAAAFYILLSSMTTVVLITGCSSGIGKFTALEFASNPKFKVWATMRKTSAWDVPHKDNIEVAALDVTSQESVDNLVAEIIKKEGKIDILVNNAGFGLGGYIESVSVDEAKAVFDVNVWGVVRMLHAVLPHMRVAMSGYVMNISSTSGIRGAPCYDFYTGSKFALEGITDSLRYTLAPFNIPITNINPGPVRTCFTDRFGHADLGGKGTRDFTDETGFLTGYCEKQIQSLSVRMQSGEAQSVEEVAKVIVNQALAKENMKTAEDVPFNMGTSIDSQRVLDRVRVNPTGWGGLYSDMLKTVPPLPSAGNSTHKA